MLSSANNYTPDRADIFKVPSPRKCDVTIVDELIVCRVDIHPAVGGDINLDPGLGDEYVASHWFYLDWMAKSSR